LLGTARLQSISSIHGGMEWLWWDL
jgi:hypothetical protein